MATTTNYGWTTPDDTALVKDGASAIRTLGSSVDSTVKNLNPETTLGDISYRSSTANTNTRLAIGTTGQVLTVSAGVPAWTTLGSGMSLITKTTFTTSTGFNVDSIFSTTYDYYYVTMSHSGNNVGDMRLQFRASGSTDTNTNYNTQRLTVDDSTVSGSRATSQSSAVIGRTNTVRGMTQFWIQNPNNSLPTAIQSMHQLNIEGPCRLDLYYSNFSNTTSFTGIRIEPELGNTTGTIYVYGLAV